MSRKIRPWFLMTVLIGVVALPCLARGEEPAGEAASAPKAEGLRIFTAGHSLHWYLPDILKELAAAAKIEGHTQVGVQSLGVSRTSQHWEQGPNSAARQALTKGDVDLLTLSPIGFPDDGIDNFVKLGLEHNPKMRFTVQISWGGPDVDNQDFNMMALMGARPDREKTPEQLKELNAKNEKAGEEQIAKINEQYGRQVVLLVPTSQAHAALRTMVYNKEIPGLTKQAELFADTIGHPTAPVQALNAYLHFAVIYGRSPVGLPIPAVLRNSGKPQWNDAKFNLALQELAWKMVKDYAPAGIKTSGEAPAAEKAAAPAAEPAAEKAAEPAAAPAAEKTDEKE